MTHDREFETLTFGIGESSLGKFLVASTERGVCAIFLRETREALLGDLEADFFHFMLVEGGGEYSSVVDKVRSLIDHPQSPFPLPLDIAGGDFIQLTLAAIRATSPGETVTLVEIAKMVGASPEAASYVADVCAKNTIAVAVPSHRIQEADDSNTRYRWGERVRRALLERERASWSDPQTIPLSVGM